MIKLRLKHPGFAAQLRSGEAFLQKTVHPTSPGSALHLAHSGAFYGKRNDMTSCNSICMFAISMQYAQNIYARKLESLVRKIYKSKRTRKSRKFTRLLACGLVGFRAGFPPKAEWSACRHVLREAEIDRP